MNTDASQMLRDALERIRALVNVFLKLLLPHSLKSWPFVLNMSGYECTIRSEGEQRHVRIKPFAFCFLDDNTMGDVPLQRNNVSISENKGFILENEFLRVELSPSGALLSLKDKRLEPPRESVLDGAIGNALVLYDDIPFYWYVYMLQPLLLC